MSEFAVGKHPKMRTEDFCTEAYNLVRYIAGEPYRPVKAALSRATIRLSTYLSVSDRRVKDLWYGEARLIRAEEMDALRLAAEDVRRKIEAGRDALRGLAGVYRNAAERLRAIDATFHCIEIARLERLADGISPLGRPGIAAAAPVGIPALPSKGRDG